ncbi:manganese efflux pump [Anaeromicropila herbilytica]|uniref:Sporulation protein YtaF n=1 Tax=Anaeromicropila herbilytica TaxID=2785025 RepID=A0A7R7IFC9_9FIRM|nr:manganese efflux pump [Anaeromicropila herbilytica]BCN32003.1 hypothetical protein bsdtb5_32980 [Anaeromicropila herbilytica]
MIFSIIIISISLSIDALGIGVSYKIKGVRIQREAKAIIGIVSMLMMLVAVMIGRHMSYYMPEDVCKIVGISILVLMGASIIRNSINHEEENTYDRDHSMEITGIEAILLALALSLDSVSAGIAVAAIGLGNLIIPVCVGLTQMFFLALGEWLVGRFHQLQNLNSKVCGLFSGSLLILIAIIRAIN